jgi:hypothetical protein
MKRFDANLALSKLVTSTLDGCLDGVAQQCGAALAGPKPWAAKYMLDLVSERCFLCLWKLLLRTIGNL